MDCSGISETLSAYIDGELTDEELSAVELHLNQCVECRQELESLKTTISLVSSLPRVSSPIDLSETIRVREAPSEGVEAALIEKAKSPPGHPVIPPPRYPVMKYLLWPALATAAVALVVIGVSLQWRPERYTGEEAEMVAVVTETADKSIPDRGEEAKTETAAMNLTEAASVQEAVKVPAPAEDATIDLTLRLECEDIESDRGKVVKILEDMKVAHKYLAMSSQIVRQERATDKGRGGEDESRVIVLLSRMQREQLYARIKNVSSIRIVGGQDILFSTPTHAGTMAMGNNGATSVSKPKTGRFSLSEADTKVAAAASRAKESPRPNARSFPKATSPPSRRRLGAASAGLSHDAESQRPRRSVQTEKAVSVPSPAAKTEAPDSALIAQSRANARKMRKSGRPAEATSLATDAVGVNAPEEDEDVRRIVIRFVPSRIGNPGN